MKLEPGENRIHALRHYLLMSGEQSLARSIAARMNVLAERLVERHMQQRPDLSILHGDTGRQQCRNDVEYHIKYFLAALENQRSSLFMDYAQWAQQLLAGQGVDPEELTQHLVVLRQTLLAEFHAEHEQQVIAQYIDPTIAVLSRQPPKAESRLQDVTGQDSLAHRYLVCLLAGDRINAANAILDAVAGGVGIKDIYLNVFQPVQYEVGRLWLRGELSVAQEHFCTAVTQWVMSRLYPQVFTGENNGFRLVAACVAGDLHEIGLRMVADLLELDGWNTCYVGANTPVRAIVDMVDRERAQVLALSATMSYHLGPLGQTIELLKQDSQFENVKVLVGGRPFLIEPTLVEAIGADAMARDAQEALLVAKGLVSSDG